MKTQKKTSSLKGAVFQLIFPISAASQELNISDNLEFVVKELEKDPQACYVGSLTFFCILSHVLFFFSDWPFFFSPSKPEIKMLRVGKYDWKSKTQPVTKDYINVLIHIHEPLSPYQLRNEDKVIMENFWQFHKLYTSTEKQDQPKFPYWQQEEEIHWDKNLEVPTEAYWKWREKGFACEGAVRYPNGFQKRSTCRCSIVVDQKAKKGFQELDYITARKKIYYSEYARLARKTKEFEELQTQLQKGTKLQINEVDGPR